MSSNRRCFLCNYKYDSKNAHIMMHSFPWREDVKKQWIKVCNILPTDNVTNLYICSKHFQPGDYYKPHSFSTKYKLNIGAIPSRKVVNTVGTGFDLPSTSYDESVIEVEIHAEVGGTSETTIDLQSTSFDESVTEVKVHAEVPESTIDLPSTSFDENAHTKVINEDAEERSDTIDLDDGQSTPKKRRFMEPRYINEISPSHVTTPRRAKRVIDLVKRSYKNQEIKIKELQDAKRLLYKKVQTLEEMVAHLKQKNLLYEQAGDQMLKS